MSSYDVASTIICPYTLEWDDIERVPWLDLLGSALRVPDAGEVRPYEPYFFEGSVVVGQQVGTDGQCSPRHSTCCETSFPELVDIL
jgi:hypothetical protein